jgi:hypothetical protein
MKNKIYIILITTIIISLFFSYKAYAIQDPVYIDKTDGCTQEWKDGVLWIKCDPECVTPATEEEWPDINVAQDEIDYWNNHNYFPFIKNNNAKVYLVKCKLDYAGVAGNDKIFISSGEVFADKESKEYTYDGTILASESALRKTLAHELCHIVAEPRFNQVERESFLTLIGASFSPGENLNTADIDHTYINPWFGELWGSYEDNSWIGFAPPLSFRPFKEYRYYYAFYDCMVNDHQEFIDYSKVPNRTRGDVDNNGVIDCDDLDMISNLKGTNAYYNDFGKFWSADYNGDNVVDKKDVKLVGDIVGSCEVVVYDKHDLNKDGKVNIEDILTIGKKLGGKFDVEVYDLHKDDKVDILDMLELDDYMKNKIKDGDLK